MNEIPDGDICMNIMICNDDGIESEGLRVLADALKDEYDVYVVAPDGQRSAFSHSVTYFYRHNRARKVDIEGVREAWAVDATPADCAYYGINGLLPAVPDLVISGINIGRNMSSDVIYSGTVAGAGEAMINRVPGMAVSLCSYTGGDFTAAAQAAKALIPVYMDDPRKHSYILNVNVPSLPVDEIKGFRVCVLGDYEDYRRPVEIHEEDGSIYLSIKDSELAEQPVKEEYLDDVHAVRDGYIAVTPMFYDLCRYDLIDSLKEIEKI